MDDLKALAREIQVAVMEAFGLGAELTPLSRQRAALRAIEAALSRPAGGKWVMVPREPTPGMSAAGFVVSEPDHDPAGVYRAMIEVIQDELARLGFGDGAINRVGAAISITAVAQRSLAESSLAGGVDQHPDDIAVDQFAEAMKLKLAEARAKGRGGWQDKDDCPQQRLSDMLRTHVEKGDPRDVANFCMFLHQRGEGIMPSSKEDSRNAERCSPNSGMSEEAIKDLIRSTGYVTHQQAWVLAEMIAAAVAQPRTEQAAGGEDDRILWGVVANAGRLSADRKPRWAHVVDATGQGSTSSAELCRRFGFDPDENVGGAAAIAASREVGARSGGGVMMMNDLVARARELANRAHAGQVDQAGRPYIEHVARVAAAVSDDPEVEAVAWLHDVLEDFGFPRRWTDFPQNIRDSVICLTRTKRESAEDYYALIATNPLAMRVKLADIADNADESRLTLLDEKTADRLRRKYAKARKALTGDDDGRG